MIYFDNASTSFPKPESVYIEVVNCMKNYAPVLEKASSKLAEANQLLRELFNIKDQSSIIFTNNATEALDIGIRSILKPKDHVITSLAEHDSVLKPLGKMQRKAVEITFLGVSSDGFINIGELIREIRSNTKMIILNHASNVLGSIQNIKEIGRICRNNGIIFMVDASQSAGVLSIDVHRDNIDLLAFPGHKGLLGPQGTGGLYINKENSLDSLKHAEFFSDKSESGTLNIPGIAGLCEGIKFINEIQRRNIYKHEEMLMDYLLTELKKLDYVTIYGKKNTQNRCAVASINIDGFDSRQAGILLGKKNIAVSTGYHFAPLIHGVINTMKRGTVRISPGYFNTINEIEEFIKAVKDIYNRHFLN